MPPRAVELHPKAIEDIRGAREWYASRSELAAAGFFSEIENGLKRIADGPEAWPVFLHGTRRFLLRRYPYSLVYRVKTSMIEIVGDSRSRPRQAPPWVLAGSLARSLLAPVRSARSLPRSSRERSRAYPGSQRE